MVKSTTIAVSRLALLASMALEWSSGNALAATRLGHSGTALAIDGPGWFIVRDPANNEHFITRCGDFFLNADGRLQNDHGCLVQGYANVPLHTIGDVMIRGASLPLFDPLSPITSFLVRSDGTLVLKYADGSESVSGQILLQDFRQPKKLVRAGACLYLMTDEAGPLPEPVPPGSAGLGLLKTNLVELEQPGWSILPEARRGDPAVTGGLAATGIPADLGIRGEGYFLLRDPDTSALFATRAGLFLVDGDGYLINYSGLRVQGWSDAALTTFGDVRIDEQGAPPISAPGATITSFQFDRQGHVLVTLWDGTQFVRGQILLHSFHMPALLARTEGGLYSGVTEAGLFPANTLPAGRAGRIEPGALELINVTRGLLALRQKLQFFEQGAFYRTGNPTDLALAGDGFFIVGNPANGDLLATRHGAFHFDEAGFLVTRNGWRLQGYNNPDLTLQGDIRLDTQGPPVASDPTASIASFKIDAEGKLNVNLSDGTLFARAQILLQRFKQSYLLKPVRGGYYANLSAARPLPELNPPGTQGLGRIQAGALEIPWKPARLVLPPRNGVRLLVTGEPGSRCVIQALTQSQKWQTLGAVTIGFTGEAEFVDPRTGHRTAGAYRVKVKWPFQEGEFDVTADQPAVQD